MEDLKVNLFGEFRVWREGRRIEDGEWDRRKARSLLKLLLTRPGHAFSKDEIVEALWPDTAPASAERSLWVTVSLLRKALEPNLERGSDSKFIVHQQPGYTFDLRSECDVDAWEFEELRKKATAARQAENLDEAIEGYGKALDLARGEFLAEDRYEDWAVEAREEWRGRRLSALSELSECLALKGRYTEAIEACEKALALDAYREDLHRQLMLCHYCAGEQALALQAYRDYAKTLETELGASPSPELIRLKERIEARDVPGVDETRRYPKPRRPLRFPYSLSRTHFVGRDPEHALLAERLREAMEGRGGAVAVEGEAGVGKTRLVEEFLGYARSRGVRVLSGRCYERELGTPLDPIMEALDPLLDTEDMPLTADAGPSEPGGFPHVYRTLAGELIQKCRSSGLVLFVDDAQWADAATLDFLSYLAKRVSGERMLVVFTYRREDAPGLSGWLRRLAERRAAATLSLDRLTREDLARLLNRMSSRGFGELSPLSTFLHRESEGNPFYAVEYLRWLIESGIVEVDGRRRISGVKGGALEKGGLPSGVRTLIEARLDSMDEGARDLMELAAAIGRTFDLGLLSRAASIGEAEVFAGIRPVMASGLVVETPQEGYYFSHDKLRQTLYEGIQPLRRRELHRRVAEALEESGGAPAELAHHYLRAKEWGPTLENLMRAAQMAEEGYAWETALEDYARALEVAEKLPDPEETKFGLHTARERLLEHMDRREERAEAVREMFELASSLGDRLRIAEVHIRRIGTLAALSDLAGAREAGREAAAIFRQSGDGAGEARAHREVGYVLWMGRDYAGALEASFRALGIHRELGDRRAEAGDALNITQVYRGMGSYDEALHWAEEAARIYDEVGDRRVENLRTYTLTAIHLDQGNLEAALDLSLRDLRLNAELGNKNIVAGHHSRCGTLHLRLGDPQRALEHFRSAVRLNRELGYARDEGYSLMSAGIALEQAGEPANATDAYRRAVKLLDAACEESGEPEDLSAKADALTLLAGTLHRPLDRPAEEALDAYEAAREIRRRSGSTRHLSKLLLNVAGLRWRMGSLEESSRDYEEALNLAREHEETAHEAAAFASLSVVYRDLGRLKESLRRGKEARGLLRELGDPQAEAYVLTSLAESYGGLGHHPSALSCLKRSLRLRREVGDGEGEVGALRDLAGIHDKMGNADLARTSRREAARKKQMLEAVSRAERRD